MAKNIRVGNTDEGQKCDEVVLIFYIPKDQKSKITKFIFETVMFQFYLLEILMFFFNFHKFNSRFFQINKEKTNWLFVTFFTIK